MAQGLTQHQVGVLLADLAAPLAVPRLEILQRNPRLGHALVTSQKAPRLARRIARIAGKSGLDDTDVANMMGAAAKRQRRMTLRKRRS